MGYRITATAWLAAGISICCLLLIVFSVPIVNTYNKEKGYTRTSCMSTGVMTIGEQMCDSCPGRKPCNKYTFTCVQLFVTYGQGELDESDHDLLREGILYSSGYQAEMGDGLCSESRCGKNSVENNRHVDKFIKKYANRTTPYECYYNSANLRSTIPGWKYSRAEAIHSMLWLALVASLCLITILVLYVNYRAEKGKANDTPTQLVIHWNNVDVRDIPENMWTTRAVFRFTTAAAPTDVKRNIISAKINEA